MNLRTYATAKIGDGWHVVEIRQRPGEPPRKRPIGGAFQSRELADEALNNLIRESGR